MMNDGTGHFTLGMSVHLANHSAVATSIALGDLDGDGGMRTRHTQPRTPLSLSTLPPNLPGSIAHNPLIS